MKESNIQSLNEKHFVWDFEKGSVYASYANDLNLTTCDRFQVVIRFWINRKYLSSEV
jgi:hypothetical protein